MADPTKVPDGADPNNVPGRSTIDPKNGPVIGNRRNYPWAWIVGIIIVLLIIWAFFGMSRRTTVVSPAMQPAPATSTVR